MSLLNPTWLWGLLALSVPLAIHLLSRKEGKVVRVGSLRFLQDSPTRQFKSIRLNELFLLALRALLIILVVVLLSQLMWPDTSQKAWVLTDEHTTDSPGAQSLIDSLIQHGYEWRLFTKDFPPHNRAHEFSSGTAWSLIDDLKKYNLPSAVILTSGRMKDFGGLRTPMPSNVSWINIPEEEDRFLLSARNSGDSLSIRVGTTSAMGTSFRNISTRNSNQKYYTFEGDSISIESADTVRIYIQSEKQFEYDETLLRAALNAILESGHVLKVASYNGSGNNTKMDWLFWLSDKPAPELPSLSKLIYYKPSTAPLLSQEHQQTWTLSKRLTEERCLQEQFTLKLMSVLFAPNNETIRMANSKDRRVMPEKLLWAASNGQSVNNQDSGVGVTSADLYIILLLLVVWIVERWVSYRRNQ